MKASDVMVRSVITVGPDTGVQEIASTLLDKRISAVPVVDGSGCGHARRICSPGRRVCTTRWPSWPSTRRAPAVSGNGRGRAA